MAARCWQMLLLCELGCAMALAMLLGAIYSLSPAMIAVTVLVALPALPCVLTAASFMAVYVAHPALRARSGRMELLRAWVLESLALARASLAISFEPLRPVNGDSGAPQPARPVLLVHGLACNGGIWRPLANALRSHGFGPVRTLNLEPLFADLDSQAACVAHELRQLRRECKGERVAVVAHSMGGLVVRAALRLIGPDDFSQIVTLASPQHGSYLARLLPGPLKEQMEPDSTWLAALNATQEGRFPIPVTCIYSVHDNLVVPARSAALRGARRHKLRGLGHLSLLSARESIHYTLATLTSCQAGQEPWPT